MQIGVVWKRWRLSKGFLSSRQDRIADGGRTGIFEAELREAELALANAMHQLNACKGDRSVPEPVEAEHDVGPQLDVTMVLPDQVVEIFRGSDFRVLRQHTVALHLPHSTVRGSIAIERDGLRWLALMFDCLAEKGFGRLHVTFRPEQEVDRLARPIHRPIKVDPFAADFQASFIDAPRRSRRRAETVPALDELRCVTPHPAQDRRVGQQQATPGHHLDKITLAG